MTAVGCGTVEVNPPQHSIKQCEKCGLDPRSGWPTQGLSSVTVISERCLVAGSLSTTAMLKGEGGVAWLQGLGVRHIVIDENGKYCGTEPPILRRCS